MNPSILFSAVPPPLLFFAAAALVPLVKGRLKQAVMLLAPLWALWLAFHLPAGDHWLIPLGDISLVLARVDRLSRVFLIIFSIITFIGMVYALKVDDDVQHAAAFVYAGATLGVTLAGDLIVLYVFWEVMAVASTFLILARRTPASQAAAQRYILVHIVGGLLLLAGLMLHLDGGGSSRVGLLALQGPAAWLIFLGVAVNAAIPPLHPWLKDAYPEATVTGAVFLSALTTKSAVYVMARMFTGEPLLIWLGALMTAFPIFYAVLENDVRRVLSYSLINQVGFMLCGVGIGTELAINGTVSHAFCHILYKALLFMSVGAVIHQTGKSRCTDLGGLYRSMPITCAMCLIGAASISAYPLFSGFVSKSMVVSAAGQQHLVAIWLILQFASAGVLDHAGIKVPFFTFFSHDSGIRTTEPPLNMLLAMAMAAFGCLFLGIYPQPLYQLLPYAVDYVPYTAAHVIGQLQLLMFGALAFCLLMFSGFYPAELRAINLDSDWFYRVGARWFYRLADRGLNTLNARLHQAVALDLSRHLSRWFARGPAHVVWTLVLPLQRIMGRNDQEVETVKQKLYTAFQSGTIPLGFSAAAATLLLVGLFWLT